MDVHLWGDRTNPFCYLLFFKISTTLTMTNPQSDHLMGMGKKRPALLGEVSGGRAIATTRLYPALF
jgi:hypothetical protein